MRTKLLISTTALLAGVALASAQEMPRGGNPSGGSVQSPSPHANPAPAPHANPSPPPSAQTSPAQRQTTGAAPHGQRDQTTGAAPPVQREQGEQGKNKVNRNAQMPRNRREGQPPSQREQREQTTTGQSERPVTQGQSRRTPTQAAPQPGRSIQGGASTTGQASSTVRLTPEQRTRIRESVLARPDAPRASNVNFRIAVGTPVPSTMRIVEVPEVIVDIDPEWRGYWYFVVGDEIIIVDRNHRIVAVLEV
jgi:hypothetical protein